MKIKYHSGGVAPQLITNLIEAARSLGERGELLRGQPGRRRSGENDVSGASRSNLESDTRWEKRRKEERATSGENESPNEFCSDSQSDS